MAAVFFQPDPAGMAAVEPSNPQTWNQYAYVGGNPLNFTDPTGMCGGRGQFPCPPPPPSESYEQVCGEQTWDPSTNTVDANCQDVWTITYYNPLSSFDPPGTSGPNPPPHNQPPQPPQPKGPQPKQCVQPNWLNKVEMPILQKFAAEHHQTIGIGLSFGAGAGNGLGYAGNLSMFLAVTPSGEAGFVKTVGSVPVFGPVGGKGFLGGPSFFLSTATALSQLSGLSVDFGAGSADGFGGGIDVSSGTSTTRTFTVGFGAGGNGHAAVIQLSSVTPICP